MRTQSGNLGWRYAQLTPTAQARVRERATARLGTLGPQAFLDQSEVNSPRADAPDPPAVAGHNAVIHAYHPGLPDRQSSPHLACSAATSPATRQGAGAVPVTAAALSASNAHRYIRTRTPRGPTAGLPGAGALDRVNGRSLGCGRYDLHRWKARRRLTPSAFRAHGQVTIAGWRNSPLRLAWITTHQGNSMVRPPALIGRAARGSRPGRAVVD